MHIRLTIRLVPVDGGLFSTFIAEEHIFPDGHIGNQRQFLMDDDDSLLLTVLDFRKLAYFAVINNISGSIKIVQSKDAMQT